MSTFFQYGGRGNTRMANDKIYYLECNAGTVFQICAKFHEVELVMFWARYLVIDRWRCLCEGSFVRRSASDFRNSWAERLPDSLEVYYAFQVHLVPVEPWMAVMRP